MTAQRLNNDYHVINHSHATFRQMVLLGCLIPFLLLEVVMVEGAPLQGAGEMATAGHGAADAKPALAQTKSLEKGHGTKDTQAPIAYPYHAPVLPSTSILPNTQHCLRHGSTPKVLPPSISGWDQRRLQISCISCGQGHIQDRRLGPQSILPKLKVLFVVLHHQTIIVNQSRNIIIITLRLNYRSLPSDYHYSPPAPPLYPYKEETPETALATPIETSPPLNAGKENGGSSLAVASSGVAQSSPELSKPSVQATGPDIKQATEELRLKTVRLDIPAPECHYVREIDVKYLPGGRQTVDFIKQDHGLFRALAHIASHNQYDPEVFRQELIDHIARHPKRFSTYLTTEGENHKTFTVRNQLYRLSDGQSVDGVEFAAFSDLHDINVFLVSKIGNTVRAQVRRSVRAYNEYRGIIVEDGHYELFGYKDPPRSSAK
ncbi:hypothetical protein PTTG_12014 [Puccinia triticina 1-1 BBBD Race 1]|uniref:Uncharacterized protein n=1 Tax=Puccinia triticina (isolate 1-1 / race 1 (BBBD)) TaxID=630390 RepID=A0A180H038_PUCT1|nr:hypothetical protein PTTG_12014 [Puccinia triticina 1-1 BBBD Race 1]WAR62873.1 hypothetical protein PtB15_15B461 [Puccinia triticina]